MGFEGPWWKSLGIDSGHSITDLPMRQCYYFGAGYHAWKAGFSVKDVMPYMRKPLQDENIHIIGEAYSDQQGWVEDAFCEAEKMLEEHYELL